MNLKRLLLLASLLAALLVALLPLGASAAMTKVEFFDTLIDLNEEKKAAMLQLMEDLANGDREAMLVHSQDAIDYQEQFLALLDQGVTEGIITDKDRKKLASNFNQVLTSLKKARDLLMNELKTQVDARKALETLNKSEGTADQAIAKLGVAGVITLAEKKPTAGFFSPGKTVWYKVTGLPANCCQTNCVTVAIVNPYADLGIVPVTGAIQGNPCTGEFGVTMGQSLGGGRVEITVNGKKRSRLVFNYGTGTALTKPTVSQFAGCYAGSYSGTVTINPKWGGGVEAVGGGVAFCIDNSGKVTVTAPGTGTGKVNASGSFSSSLGAGSVVIGGVGTVKWGGTFWLPRANLGPAATGVWTLKFKEGHASGRWSANRP